MFTVIPESIIEEGGSPRTETLLVDAGEMLAEGQPPPPTNGQTHSLCGRVYRDGPGSPVPR